MKADEQDVNDDALLDVLGAALDPVDPPAPRRLALQARLHQRASASAAALAPLGIHRANQGQWHELRTGVAMRLLTRGARGNSVLVRMAPGAVLPVHRHRFVEEGIVIEGQAALGDEVLGKGDYHLSQRHSRHARITSAAGAVIFLRGTSLGEAGLLLELLGGMLPHRGKPPETQRLGDGKWMEISHGVLQCTLLRDGGLHSRLIRMAAGASLPAHDHVGDEECVMIEGDAFFGDLLMRAGDYHLAPAGSRHGTIETDTGALFFLHGAD